MFLDEITVKSVILVEQADSRSAAQELSIIFESCIDVFFSLVVMLP